MRWGQDMSGRVGVWDVWWEKKERSKGEDLALNIPRLVCQQLVFVVPLQRRGRLGGELAVKHSLLVLQHHLVLRSDHRPGETLICYRGRKTSARLHLQASDHQVPPEWMLVHLSNLLWALLKAANSSMRPLSKWPSGGGVCQHLRGGPRET